jgi:hypothetical protein
MVLTTTIGQTTDRTVDGTVLGTSGDVARCRVMAGAAAQQKFVDYRITAGLRASSFAEGHVWLRPTTLDVIVPTTPGHLAWSPPT